MVADPQARYLGSTLGERTLVPGDDGWLSETHVADWLSRPGVSKPSTQTLPEPRFQRGAVPSAQAQDRAVA